MSQKSIKVGITHGDINSVSYEIILKALGDDRILELCTPIVYGSAKIAAFYRKALDMQEIHFNQIADASDAQIGTYNIVNVVGEDTKIDPGMSTPQGGAAAFAALKAAVADLKAGYIDVLVTAPINKYNIQNEEFHFPGHTEYLQDAYGQGAEALMVLCCDNMRVALVTTHMPIKDVPGAITKEGIIEKLKIFYQSLQQDFAIPYPRIAVLSLNPHSGESGMLGSEEEEIIIPAIKEAQQEKMLVFGPYAVDGLFGSGGYSKFDGILAMYHDQGLAPFKALAMDAGVNFTAGLPYVRTSPDHGTGYDIVGKGQANAESLRQAIYYAIDIYRSRQRQ